jgi:hypothetical protein
VSAPLLHDKPAATAARQPIALTSAPLHLAALLLYLLLALVATWPLALHATDSVIGLNMPGDTNVGVDAYQHTWHHWWVAEALAHGRSPFFTDRLYYPEGIDLFWQTVGFTQGIVSAPVTLALGPVAGVNFTIFLSFVVGGYAAFLLARRLSGSTGGALVAGAIYAFSPYHIQKVVEGSIELGAIQWLPLYVLSLYALLERPNWRRALLAAALLLVVSLGAWYYGLFSVMFTGMMAAVWASQGFLRTRSLEARTAEPQNRRTVGPGTKEQKNKRTKAQPTTYSETESAQPSAISTLLWGLSPILIWLLVLAPKIATIGQSIDQSTWDLRAAQIDHSADLIDFFLPNPLHPLWGDALRSWRSGLYNNPLTFWNVALGWVGLALGLYGLAAAWRRTWRWGALLLLLFILGLGPALRVFGYQTEIPLPFGLIGGLPGIRMSHRPGHIVVIMTLMLAILAAFGTARLLKSQPRAWRPLLIGGLAACVLLVDGLAQPLVIIQRTVPAFYRALPAPDGGLMALPMYVNINQIDHMYNQMTHGWPIFAGYVARPPEYRFVYETDGISQLREGRAEPDDIVSPGWPESGRRALAAHRIRYIALDLTVLRAERKLAAGKDEYFAEVRSLLEQLGVGAPVAADADLEAYVVPGDWPVGPVAALGEGWRGLESQPDTGYRWRWMGERAVIRLFNPHGMPLEASIRFELASYKAQREVTLLLDGLPAGTFPVGTDRGVRELHLTLPPGEHLLTLSAPAEPDPASSGEPISVRAFSVSFAFSEPVQN